MSILKGVKLNSANARGFLFFLFLTALVATLIKLSKNYEVVRTLEVAIVNLPLDKTVSTIDPQYIEVSAQVSGFALLRNTFNGGKLEVPYSNLSRDASGSYTFETVENKNTIKRSLANQATIISIRPKLISIEVDSLSSKKFEIVPRADITYATGFNEGGPIKVEPDSITVVGPSAVLKKINRLHTKSIDIQNADRDIHQTVAVETDSLVDGLRFSQTEVVINQVVARFTEGTVTVPITILNDPNKKLKILPKTVQIIYKVALEDFEKVGASDFLVTCDYKKVSSSSDYLALKIEKAPQTVRAARLSTKQAKYIIVN